MSTSKPSPRSSVTTGLTLQAVTRKKRPSFNPQKWRSGLTPEQQTQCSQSHGSSASSPPLQKELQGLNPTMRNPKTAALDFEEFSYVDDQGTFRRIGATWLDILCEFLAEYYQAESVSEILPYLVVWCKDTVPPPSERPFMIAGLVAVWLVQGKDMYPPDMGLGEMGHSEDNRWISLEENLLADLKIFHIPKAKTLSTIMNQHFPEALAISYINHSIVVEFKEINLEQYKKRLDSLPHAISETEVALRYHNGPVHGQKLKRLKEPNPTKFDGQYDDTDYAKAYGCFYPGAMLSSKNNTLISAGIQVQKQQKIGVTVAIHCWDEQLESDVKLSHEDYTVKQGDWADGTVVGLVMDRIGSSDIGVAKLDKPFSNRFLDLNGSPSSLLHSNDLTAVNESFWIDSFVTGPQLLASNGKRVFKANKRGKELFGDPSALPGPGRYVEFVQGIYATSAPEINRQPKIREGVCGAAIIRARGAKLPDSTRTEAQGKTLTPHNETSTGQGSSPQVLTPKKRTPPGKGPGTPSSTGSATPLNKQLPQEETTGEVAGFMRWSDIQSQYNGDRLLCFADAVDGLIEDGWKVMLAPEKRKAGAAGLDDDSDTFITKSPSKK